MVLTDSLAPFDQPYSTVNSGLLTAPSELFGRIGDSRTADGRQPRASCCRPRSAGDVKAHRQVHQVVLAGATVEVARVAGRVGIAALQIVMVARIGHPGVVDSVAVRTPQGERQTVLQCLVEVTVQAVPGDQLLDTARDCAASASGSCSRSPRSRMSGRSQSRLPDALAPACRYEWDRAGSKGRSGFGGRKTGAAQLLRRLAADRPPGRGPPWPDLARCRGLRRMCQGSRTSLQRVARMVA